MINKKPKAIDLFCGCGGLTEGLKQAGFDVVGAVDNNKVFLETYKLNHPGVSVVEDDIRKINIGEFMDSLGVKKGELHLLAGCPPCQGFSTVGTKDPEDKRNNLVFEWLRFVEEFMPKSVMMENVPGLAKDGRSRKVVERLKELGYYTGDMPMVMNAADYGVPQRRRRMLIIAGFGKRIKIKRGTGKKKTVREAIGNMETPKESDDSLHAYPEKRSNKIIKRIKMIPKDGGSFRTLPRVHQLKCHRGKDRGFRDVYGRMKWDDVSPTITGGCTNPSKGRFLHPEQDRSITLREAALLQGFPRDYEFSLTGGKGAVSLMIGNALPPLFIKEHAMEIKKALNQ